MSGPERLLNAENNWISNVGACFPGEDRVVFRDHDLFRDLKDLPWMALLLYGITGRLPSPKQVRLFEGIWTLCTSYPDPRLWNNRVAALAGTARSTAALGLSAANAVSEASIYGGRPEVRAIDFLYRIRQQLALGAELLDLLKNELKEFRTIAGYGRPITHKDERIEPLMALAETLGLSGGAYVKLAFQVEELLITHRFRLQMNIAALAAALAADQGMARREFYHYLILSFSAGITACYIDASEKHVGTLFPLRCTRINYAGNPLRRWQE